MKSFGEDRMTGHVITPVIEGDSPRVRAVVGPETGQSVHLRFIAKPSAVTLAHGTIGSLNLRMMEDGLAKDKITVGSPSKVMQSVVRVFTSKAAEDLTTEVSFTVSVGILKEGHVWLF